MKSNHRDFKCIIIHYVDNSSPIIITIEYSTIIHRLSIIDVVVKKKI